ncbi:MAG: sigma-54-dependent Fis family transcriptional regulator [Parachlamydiaceae bacterium]|nr:sigma-54-dependent Fis family transcriptional regulator [Parachlamydiaceae bacterium]
MAIDKVLIVEDESIVRSFLTEVLRRKNIEVTAVENGTKALAAIKNTTFDLVITDMKMPDITGIDVLRAIKEISPQTFVVVITGFGSIENAVEAMRCGAYHYLIKPFSPETIETVIEKAGEHLSLIEENHYLRQQVGSNNSSSGFKVIGESPVMLQILSEIDRIAKSNAAVFIHGESGTGKEVIAQAIHTQSMRASNPFIKVNCAAIPDTLIESEFFGHEKGSFTGASAKRTGRFELANHGTLLLDEVTEIPTLLQAKLLRAIQEQEFERVGGTRPVKVDVRLISTSNRNMKEAIAQKILREDLYYRLNVVPIYLPPLRERREDIIPLANFFLQKISGGPHKEHIKKLSAESQKKLLEYSWPGNARELANVIERAVVMDSSPLIAPDHLYIDQGPSNIAINPAPKLEFPIGTTLEELEKRFIIETLHVQHNNRTETAKMLGISPRTLRNKLNAYNIS